MYIVSQYIILYWPTLDAPPFLKRVILRCHKLISSQTVCNSSCRLSWWSQEHSRGVILHPRLTYWFISRSLSVCRCGRPLDEAVNRSEDTGMLCFDWRGNPARLLFRVKVTVSARQRSTRCRCATRSSGLVVKGNHVVCNLSSVLSTFAAASLNE